ncbi:MAG TPA: tRNA (5-methylaminomethyl-2-thiouridine)(34)-methyltransferase MnmD [Accumulibacter sp.]|nr:tRNA (5-methylaminomethyl-2-thiouridine)(34)-methyltransferase MnmD [Accumulibacter sp.]HMW18106.1 tRNA (5-methylaminomethyl-2-thiouridine)(34)-methyltransferase MnmD [Accumulibacter sp.]HNC17202.1 tRNA (5-methylaminomethyl-2-thiouridine)(34)-methyltransferase MnmD [Accumulibacter sp.]HNE14243.1 tRNA (5-methylaminomethyl-2-thiouridine)(34)-methyltransferase MnmD [Accumulibacter sp.]HNO57261.1 tRNA (5-methylaminomethyl-2-thiouridine)(34)-methyltransferase MnmD [Accumulibacter sp.]
MPILDHQEKRLVKTADGSHSIDLPGLAEQYHSTHGAIQESQHVFIDHGYGHAQPAPPRRLQVLEMGFGTGLNVLLTWAAAERERLPVSYTTLEAHPLRPEFAHQLNYPRQIRVSGADAVFAALHECAWSIPQSLGMHFTFLKLRIRLQDFEPGERFDLIYYDAFSPNVQPELWTREIFEKLYRSLSNGGLLLTYCAKGQVKRNLKAAGFIVENLPGPPGKREITRAYKP